MTADEIAVTGRRFRERLEQLLTAEQLAHYDSFQARLARQIAQGDPGPVAMSPDEQAVFALIDADSAACGLRAQLDVLTRVGTPPQ